MTVYFVMIYELKIILKSFEDHDKPDYSRILGSQLHGLLFDTILPLVNAAETTWLHDHTSPKPFALSPIIEPDKRLSGLRYTTFTSRAAQLMAAAWQETLAENVTLQLGDQPFQIGEIIETPPVEFMSLMTSSARSLKLRFLTATAFKQGRSSMVLTLPLPVNVFKRPLDMWQTYAPVALKSPTDWLDWCQDKVYVSYHNIRTVNIPVNRHGRFTGFVGSVTFGAPKGDETQLRVWQALGRLAAYCGVGAKTAMGMGSVLYDSGYTK